MSLYRRFNSLLETRKDYGAIFLRFIVGVRLIYGTQDNVFSWERMIEFSNFLEQHRVGFPLIAAVVSVYAQFICGLLYIAGAFTRGAALIMIINFIAALAIAHIGVGFLDSFDALMMLFASIFFVFYGAGKFSVDNLLFRQSKNL